MPHSRLIGVAALLLAIAASALSLTDRWNDLAGGIMIEVGYYQTPDRYILVGYCSLGVPVYWYEGSGRVFGFLTAGHCTNQYYQDVVYQPYRSSQVNNYIGTVLRDSYYSDTSPVVDAALIRIEVSDRRTVRPWIATSAVGYQTDALVDWYYTPSTAPGSGYSKLGFNCGYDSGLSIIYYGPVQDERGAITLSYLLVKGRSQTISACRGDSGGPVFYMWSQRIDSMTVYYANILGLIQGGNAESNPTVLLVAPIHEALNRLQVYLYTYRS